MRFLSIVAKILGYIWLILACLLIAAGVIGVWMKEGFSGVQELLSPFNVVNWLVTMATLLPGIGLLMLAKRLEDRKEAKPPP